MKGYTSKSLSNLLGNSAETIASRLRGEIEFTLREAQILAKHFGISVKNLFSKDPNLLREKINSSWTRKD